MRVCHIISGDLWAGAEVMTYTLLKGLLKYPDLQLSTILFNEGKLSEEIRKIGIPVDVVDEARLNVYQLIRTIRKILLHQSNDVIHSHRLKENLLAYHSLKNKNGVRFLCTQHGMPEPFEKQNMIKDIVLSKYHLSVIASRFQYMVAVSENIREFFINEHVLLKDKVVVIHNGIDNVDNFVQKKDSNSFTIGSSGRLFPVKDYPLMIEIGRKLIEKKKGIRFELAGDGPDMERLKNLVQEKNLEESFSIRGFIGNISTFYKGLDLFLNTSIHEGIPMSVLEAMAHGLPVVAPNVGGLKEILEDGVQGYLVESRNADDFAQKCLHIYENDSIRMKMGIAARERVEKKFSLDQMTKKYYQLYFKMMNN